MQKIIIHGFIGKDAESYKGYTKFSVACTSGKGEKQGTTWFDVMLRGQGLLPYLKKRKEVIVEGNLNITKSEKDGKTYTNITVWGDNVEFCGKKDDANHQAAPTPQPTHQEPQPKQQSQTIFVGNDGLPF